jgi:hypothetical protein
MGKEQRSILHLKALTIIFVASLVFVIAATVIGPFTAEAALSDSEKTTLAEKYSPVFHYVAGERCYPVDVEYYIAQCNLNKSTNGNNTLISPHPSVQDLGNYSNPSQTYYLDNRMGTNHDDRIASAYSKNESSLGYTIYAHVAESNGSVIIQYWIFYVYYQGTYTSHEGDWETVQIVLSNTLEPREVFLSQHNAGYRVGWGDMERSADHPNVYVAKDSHANYIRYWEGQIAAQRDVVNNDGKVIGNDRYDIVVLGDAGSGNHPSSQDWIDFSGRWGDLGNGVNDYADQRGTMGPAYIDSGNAYKNMTWGASLPQQNMNLVAAQLALYYYNLLYLLIVFVPAFWIGFKVYRRYKKKQLTKPYLHLIDFKGNRIERIANILAIAGLIIGLVSAFFPYYYAQVNADTGAYHTNGFEDIVSVDGINGAQIYALDPEMGRVQLSSIPIPFGMLIAASIAIFVMKLIGQEEKNVGKEYLGRGFSFITPLILTLIMVMFLSQIMPDLNPAPGQMATDSIITTVSHSPLGGQIAQSISPYGTVDLRWGIGLGGLLMIVAAALMAAAGIMMIKLGLKGVGKCPLTPTGPGVEGAKLEETAKPLENGHGPTP